MILTQYFLNQAKQLVASIRDRFNDLSSRAITEVQGRDPIAAEVSNNTVLLSLKYNSDNFSVDPLHYNRLTLIEGSSHTHNINVKYLDGHPISDFILRDENIIFTKTFDISDGTFLIPVIKDAVPSTLELGRIVYYDGVLYVGTDNGFKRFYPEASVVHISGYDNVLSSDSQLDNRQYTGKIILKSKGDGYTKLNIGLFRGSEFNAYSAYFSLSSDSTAIIETDSGSANSYGIVSVKGLQINSARSLTFRDAWENTTKLVLEDLVLRSSSKLMFENLDEVIINNLILNFTEDITEEILVFYNTKKIVINNVSVLGANLGDLSNVDYRLIYVRDAEEFNLDGLYFSNLSIQTEVDLIRTNCPNLKKIKLSNIRFVVTSGSSTIRLLATHGDPGSQEFTATISNLEFGTEGGTVELIKIPDGTGHNIRIKLYSFALKTSNVGAGYYIISDPGSNGLKFSPNDVNSDFVSNAGLKKISMIISSGVISDGTSTPVLENYDPSTASSTYNPLRLTGVGK